MCKVADFGLSREIESDDLDGAYTTKVGYIVLSCLGGFYFRKMEGGRGINRLLRYGKASESAGLYIKKGTGAIIRLLRYGMASDLLLLVDLLVRTNDSNVCPFRLC